MNKVDFTLKNGRVERMHPKIAELLQRKGKGTYQTTALTQAPQRAVLVPQASAEAPVEAAGYSVVETDTSAAEPDVVVTQTADHEPQNEPEVSQESVEPSVTAVDLASMSVDELREYAKKQGVAVHHRAGAKTIIDAIENKA